MDLFLKTVVSLLLTQDFSLVNHNNFQSGLFSKDSHSFVSFFQLSERDDATEPSAQDSSEAEKGIKIFPKIKFTHYMETVSNIMVKISMLTHTINPFYAAPDKQI